MTDYHTNLIGAQLVGLQATAVDLAKEAVAVASQAPANQRDRDRYVATAEQLRAERDAARAEVERLAVARAEVERLRSRIATLERDLARVKEAGACLMGAAEGALLKLGAARGALYDLRYQAGNEARETMQAALANTSDDALADAIDHMRAALSDAAGGAPQSRREEDGDALATAALDLLRATDRYQDTPEGQAVRAALNRWGDAAGGATSEPVPTSRYNLEGLTGPRPHATDCQFKGEPYCTCTPPPPQTPTPPPCTHHWVLAAYGPNEGKYSCVKCGAILERPASPGGGEGT